MTEKPEALPVFITSIADINDEWSEPHAAGGVFEAAAYEIEAWLQGAGDDGPPPPWSVHVQRCDCDPDAEPLHVVIVGQGEDGNLVDLGRVAWEGIDGRTGALAMRLRFGLAVGDAGPQELADARAFNDMIDRVDPDVDAQPVLKARGPSEAEEKLTNLVNAVLADGGAHVRRHGLSAAYFAAMSQVDDLHSDSDILEGVLPTGMPSI